MNTFLVLFQKEWRENIRNFKILWIPLVFILFGITEPVMNYYMPQILSSVGNLPEGTVIEFPSMTSEQILMSTISQYQLIGMLVVILAFSGIISRERKNGTATLLYVRPLSFTGYVGSKLAILSIIVLGSFILGIVASLYYTSILFGAIDFLSFIEFTSIYVLWLLFVISIVLFTSAALSTGMASSVSFVLVIIVQVIDGLLGTYWTISPWKLPMYAGYVLNGDVESSSYIWSILITILAISFLLMGAVFFTKNNVWKAKI
ncbi:ABC transporter permease subunit [uncultured Psychrobacillus sp.]|uniref:ABC transporter permease n=1 Tax=uncultured Psychrobacillus sp. TaxID=1551585 RepID=UPI0026124881|nr:ABC transporter permease subunit [uncultured Psychrobacillus sp.]